MIALLLFQASWHVDGLGIWHHLSGTSFSVADISAISRQKCLERVLRYKQLRSASLFVGPQAKICIGLGTPDDTVCGYLGKKWILAEFPHGTWKTQLAEFPLKDIADQATTLMAGSSKGLDSSVLNSKTGQLVKLPSRYAWLDEKLGMAPLNPPDHLICRAWKEPVRIYQFSLKQARKAHEVLGYSGFSSRLFELGQEKTGNQMTGVAYKLAGEVLILVGDSKDFQTKEFRNLASLLKNRIK